ncbi:MAG: plastocyanin/azurin family copper-binding protein [Methanofollis liminatans]|jgi:plastocyanin|nr:plastocyanin/azurin family copper-binding protein [Methanofollis liminatans]
MHAHQSTLIILIALLACIAGCTGEAETPAPTETVTLPTETTTMPTETMTLPPDAVEITAENFAFDRQEIAVPAGSTVVIRFENRDAGIGHNVAVYETDAAENAIFRGDIITGPAETVYTFTAPDAPGTYVFLCDPHPVQMRGAFVVT